MPSRPDNQKANSLTSFGTWIRRRRKALDLTQQLAERIGCSLSLIFKIESDERRPSRQIAEAKMDRWAHAFGLDLLGTMSLSEGQNEEALAYFNQSLALSKGIGNQLSAAQTAIHLGQSYAALRSDEQAKRLLQEAKWAFILLDALLSFVKIPNGPSDETKLAIALSILSDPAVTPHLRARSERIRDEISASLKREQIETAKNLAEEKKAEAWAQDILR
jgi:transcriptional regulator with XRE-family HTH domain